MEPLFSLHWNLSRHITKSLSISPNRAEAEMDRTTIATPFGSCHYRRTPFAISTSAQVCQRLSDHIVHGLSFRQAYVDDILFFSSTLAESEKHFRDLFRHLDTNALKINKEKTILGQTNFIGCNIDRNGIRPPLRNSTLFGIFTTENSERDTLAFYIFTSLQGFKWSSQRGRGRPRPH